MARGAVLIGCGFEPTDEDVQDAIQNGYVRNCGTVTTATAPEFFKMNENRAVATYTHVARTNGWDYPDDFTAVKLTSSGGREMWSVYPSSGAPGQDSIPDLLQAKQRAGETRKKWWQFWKK